MITAGAIAEWGPVTMVFAPALVRVRNLHFQTIPSTTPGRSSLQPPWYTGEISADLPYRPGVNPFTAWDLGQSSLALRARGVTGGVSSEEQWWGPGRRNALVLSNHAPGFPHAFLRTTEPVATLLGTLEAKWLVGALTRSLYFGDDPSPDLRSLSGLALTFSPAAEAGLTFGIARTVQSPITSASRLPVRIFDVITQVGRQDEGIESERPAEQILSLFGRWVFPRSGFETYFEWARLELPTSFRDLLVMPNHTQGYTVGASWLRAVPDRALATRLNAEVTYLEQSNTYRIRPTPVFYASPTIREGYTHRGRVLGAAIGPGSSSQWVSADLVGRGGEAGAFAARIRWENDAYYRQPTGRSEVAHDVSMLGGIRASAAAPWFRITAELTRMARFNYLYQNLLQGFTAEGAVDPWNTTLRLTVTPTISPSDAPAR
jgi:hypothetical protein